MCLLRIKGFLPTAKNVQNLPYAECAFCVHPFFTNVPYKCKMRLLRVNIVIYVPYATWPFAYILLKKLFYAKCAFCLHHILKNVPCKCEMFLLSTSYFTNVPYAKCAFCV